MGGLSTVFLWRPLKKSAPFKPSKRLGAPKPALLASHPPAPGTRKAILRTDVALLVALQRVAQHGRRIEAADAEDGLPALGACDKKGVLLEDIDGLPW